MSAPPVAGKVCIVCGQDCSGKPRTKDQQGRYTCKECFDKLMARRQSAPTAAAAPAVPAPGPRSVPAPISRPAVPPRPVQTEEAPDDAGVVAALMDEAPGFTDTCPSCGSGMTGGSVICTICGHNKETGRALGVRLLKEPKERRARGPGVSLSMSPLLTFFICLVVFAAPPALMMAGSGAALPAQALSVLFGLSVAIWTIVQGFRTSPMSGVLLLITLFLGPLALYWLYFVFVKNENDQLKAAWAANLIAIALMVFAIVASMQSGDLPA